MKKKEEEDEKKKETRKEEKEEEEDEARRRGGDKKKGEEEREEKKKEVEEEEHYVETKDVSSETTHLFLPIAANCSCSMFLKKSWTVLRWNMFTAEEESRRDRWATLVQPLCSKPSL